MRFLWKAFKWLFAFTAVFVLAAGLYIGQTVYDRLLSSPWDQILGIPNQSGNLAEVRRREAEWGWEPVETESDDGLILSGTYVPREEPSHRTVILVHGLYSNRAMCLPLVDMYQQMDYNVLLIDLRGHGESGGRYTMWGMKEIDDFRAWLALLRGKDPEVRVGIHGISLGGAMAILASGSPEGEDFLFCIADSAYADPLALARDKLYAWTGDARILSGMDLVTPFFQAVMFFHTGKLLQDITPLDAAKRMRAPALFLHGGEDGLVPPASARALGDACGSAEKRVLYFEGAGHAQERGLYPEAYQEAVMAFIAGR